MKQLLRFLRENWIFFACWTAVALALRLFFVFHWPHVAGDTFVYSDIAKNWLDHGIYGLTDNGSIQPTLIRLPGYPSFLAVMFAIFGHVAVACKRRSTERTQIDFDHSVLFCVQMFGNSTCGLQFDAVALAIVEREAITLKPFLAGYRQASARIKSAA